MFSQPNSIAVTTEGQSIRITVEDSTYELSRTSAQALQEAITDALTDRESFLRTEGIRRGDGSYVIRRRMAESAGNSTVFDDFQTVSEQFDTLPNEFGAGDIECMGITGSRRHMVVWHFIEHPAFPAELAARNPLTARKNETD